MFMGKELSCTYEVKMTTPLRMFPFYVVRKYPGQEGEHRIAKNFSSTHDAIRWITVLDKNVSQDRGISLGFDLEEMRFLRAENIRRNRAHLSAVKKDAGCVFCGCAKDLSFHHVDPRRKSYDFQDLVIWGSTDELDAELSKTVVLCTRHHRLLHGWWNRYPDHPCRACIYRRGMQCHCRRPDVWCLNSGNLLIGTTHR